VQKVAGLFIPATLAKPAVLPHMLKRTVHSILASAPLVVEGAEGASALHLLAAASFALLSLSAILHLLAAASFALLSLSAILRSPSLLFRYPCKPSSHPGSFSFFLGSVAFLHCCVEF
jgi:hypothetical protein